MPPEVKRITDPNTMDDYLKRLFSIKPVYLKTKNLNIETASFLYNGDFITFKISEIIPDEKVNLYIRNGNELLIAHTAVSSRRGNDYLCRVKEIIIMNLPRKEERLSVVENKTGANVYISGIISEATLKQNFEDNRRRLTALKDDLEEKLTQKYNKAVIYAVSEQKNDARMSYFINERKPYFIKNITERSDDEQYRYYIESIFTEDRDPDKRLISEIAVPFLYRYMMPFGYLRVNNSKPLTEEDFSFLKRQGMSISTFFTNDRTFIKSSDDHIAVTDLSLTGLGVIFKERTLIRHFREGNLIIFTVYLPGKKTANVMCQVKNINVYKNASYRVGCGIQNLDAIGEVNYSEYLASLGAGKA